jgi:hypothetical protein
MTRQASFEFRVSALSRLILGLVIACFPAVCTVELAVFGEANPVIGAAQGAVLDARATILGLVANQAKKDFVGHGECLAFRNNLPRIVPSSKDKIKSRCDSGPVRRGRNQIVALASSP